MCSRLTWRMHCVSNHEIPILMMPHVSPHGGPCMNSEGRSTDRDYKSGAAKAKASKRKTTAKSKATKSSAPPGAPRSNGAKKPRPRPASAGIRVSEPHPSCPSSTRQHQQSLTTLFDARTAPRHAAHPGGRVRGVRQLPTRGLPSMHRHTIAIRELSVSLSGQPFSSFYPTDADVRILRVHASQRLPLGLGVAAGSTVT